jgi:hypothetical protein
MLLLRGGNSRDKGDDRGPRRAAMIVKAFGSV